MRTGGCLVVLGFLYCGYQVYTRGGRRSAPADAGFADCLNFYRSELGRLRDFHNAVWSRLLAIIPGYMVFCLGFAMAIRKGALLIGAFALIALALGSGQETVQARHSGNYRDHRLVIRTSELLLSALVEKM